ncbi:MAG: DUF983 domain-containing protein [Parvibaculales bacterium]
MGEKRQVKQAMWRGMTFKCPACGEGPLFEKYLKVTDHCTACGEVFSGHQADDAPPYFTIFILGHLIIPTMYFVERAYMPPLWVHIVLFSTIAVIASLISLPATKGATVGLQWALRMHGFNDAETEGEN